MSQYNIPENIILKAFNRSGFFIEAGASDPIDQNNTYCLEQHGWTGLLVEPRPVYNDRYKEIRSKCIVENYALVDFSVTQKTIDFVFHPSGHESAYHPFLENRGTVEKVPCCTLDYLLRKHSIIEVDFFSLDVEGNEHQVLEGIDFNYCKFNCILVEGHGPDPYAVYNRKEDFSYLENHGYKLHDISIPHQYLYVHESFTNFDNITY